MYFPGPPPGVPADRLAALRKAFVNTLQDATTLDDASRQGLNVSLISPDDLMKTLEVAYRFDEKTIDMVRTKMQAAEQNK